MCAAAAGYTAFGEEVRVCVWGGGEASALLAPVPLRLHGQAQFGRRSFYLSRTHTRPRVLPLSHSQSAERQAGNMTSSYNLDFLPDMMVESHLLVPGDRM